MFKSVVKLSISAQSLNSSKWYPNGHNRQVTVVVLTLLFDFNKLIIKNNVNKVDVCEFSIK